MRALSWKQPFGTAMLHGKIETRKWDTRYRGLVLICTSKSGYTHNQMMAISGSVLCDRLYDKMVPDTGTAFSIGEAIAVGELIDTRPMLPDDELKTLVKYNPSLFCHIYRNVRAIKKFPWKGSLGWRTVSSEVEESIEYMSIPGLHHKQY